MKRTWTIIGVAHVQADVLIDQRVREVQRLALKAKARQPQRLPASSPRMPRPAT